MWTSTETGGTETDLYVGYNGKIGEVTFDISYWEYMYPEDRNEDGEQLGISDSDYSDYILSVGAAGFTAAAYIAADSDNDENNYFTLAYAYDKFTFTYGMWDLEHPDQGDEYTHLTVMYAATPEVKFGISKAFSDLDDDTGVEEDPLFYVAYDLAFDLK